MGRISNFRNEADVNYGLMKVHDWVGAGARNDMPYVQKKHFPQCIMVQDTTDWPVVVVVFFFKSFH